MINFSPKSRIGPGRFALPAAGLTLAVFIALPLLETMRGVGRDSIEIRSVDTLALEPPSPALPEPPALPQEPRASEHPKPQLARQSKSLPLNAVLDFSFGRDPTAADFEFDFEIAAPRADVIDNSIFSLSEIDKNPTAIARTQPIYPLQAKMRRIEGMVLLEFIVAEDGSVHGVETIDSEPGEIFVAAAHRAVSRWKFEPGLKDGRPVAVRVRQRLTFRLE